MFADETRAVTFTLTGARLKEVLEHGVAKASLLQGPYPQLSGVSFTYDRTLPDGQRIVGALKRADGRVIAATDLLRVSFVTFPACKGGDGYKVPEAADACKAVDANPESAPRTAQLLIDYVEAMGGRIVAPPVGRVVRLN